MSFTQVLKIPTYVILGYQRSGTTWFANLFNSHPDVIYRHEYIGRCWEEIPAGIYENLKLNHGVNDEEFSVLIDKVITPNVESDRPPFFKKNHFFLANPKAHYLLWAGVKVAPFLQGVYNLFYKPSQKNTVLAIKETRSSTNMDSILKGLRSDCNIILFRHPCGAIASTLNGIESGKMPPISKNARHRWFNEHKDNEYVQSLALSEEQISNIPTNEFLALRWRVQNKDYLDLADMGMNTLYVGYEKFIENYKDNVKRLFDELNLSFDDSVSEFLAVSQGEVDRNTFKDSSSQFYSVYRSKKFDPNDWQSKLSDTQIEGIVKHTADILDKLNAKSFV